MKERSTLGSWRDRGRGKEGGDAKGSEETEEKAGSWRVRKPEKAKGADETGVYGDCMPAEWKLQKMYKHLKVENNKLITWLVESTYPCSKSLPPYITLSRKQAKGTWRLDKQSTERNLNNIVRPPKIRNHCQQHRRRCPQSEERTRRYDESPRLSHS